VRLGREFDGNVRLVGQRNGGVSENGSIPINRTPFNHFRRQTLCTEKRSVIVGCGSEIDKDRPEVIAEEILSPIRLREKVKPRRRREIPEKSPASDIFDGFRNCEVMRR
jgi:hypothetical protein